MDSVAAKCAVSKHTLYRRYPSKDLLFKAVLEKHSAATLERLKSVESCDGDPVESLRSALYESIEFSLSLETLEILQMGIAAVPRFPEIGAQFLAIERAVFDQLEPRVQQAQANGDLAAGDPRAVASQLYYSLIGETWIHRLNGHAAGLAAADQLSRFDLNWRRLLYGIATPS